jgi:hypothetical protein
VVRTSSGRRQSACSCGSLLPIVDALDRSRRLPRALIILAIPIAAAIQILLHEWWSSRADRRTLPANQLSRRFAARGPFDRELLIPTPAGGAARFGSRG